MGIFDIFKKIKTPSMGRTDLLGDLSLDKLKTGYLLDYDLKTWEVEACNRYEWGEDDVSHEWQLRSADEVVFLEKESDDEDEWSVNRSIQFGRLGSEIQKHILETGDPPGEIVFEGTTYYQTEMAGGHFYKNGKEPGQEMLSWSYEDDTGRRYLTLEQWGEADFHASAGIRVEPYQFTNILPRSRE
jgi:hypothetical protein